MSGHFVMALDCGTTSLKAVLVDRRSGAVVASAGADYSLAHPAQGYAEQSATEIWDAVGEGCRAALAAGDVDPEAIDALVCVATWKAILPLDEHHHPLMNAMIWLDSRAPEQSARLNESVGAFVGTGQEYWPRLMWLKQARPDIWNAARHIVGLNTYLKYRATGRLVTEPSDDFIRSPVPQTDAYYARVLDAADLASDVAKFPDSMPATAEIGSLTQDAADHLGLTTRTRVFNGCGDLPAVTIGTGSATPDDVHIYLGSSSWFARVTTSHGSTPAPLTFTMDGTQRGEIFGLQSACIAYDWAVAQLYSAELRELAGDVNAVVNRDVADTEPGAGGLLATHWLTGELPPVGAKKAKGTFINLTPLHDRRHMIRAVMESVGFSHRVGIERDRATGRPEVESIRVVGGGALSDVWMQIFADILKIPVEVPEDPQLMGAMGGYYCAMLGLGDLEDYSAVRQAVPIARRFRPRPETAETYDRLYSAYTKLSPALHEIFAELNGEQ